MRVTILYFAVLRDLTGLSSEEVTLPADVDVAAKVGPWLEGRHPQLAGRLGVVRLAIDESFVGLDTALHEGAVIALIPPVAGG